MQEEVTGKAVAIIIDGAKISEHTLEKALKAFALTATQPETTLAAALCRSCRRA